MFFISKTQNCVKSCRMWAVDTNFLESGCIYELFNPNNFLLLQIIILSICIQDKLKTKTFIQYTRSICNASCILCIVLVLKKSAVEVLSWMFSKDDMCHLDSSMKFSYHGSLKNTDHFCLFSYTCPHIKLVVGTLYRTKLCWWTRSTSVI